MGWYGVECDVWGGMGWNVTYGVVCDVWGGMGWNVTYGVVWGGM